MIGFIDSFLNKITMYRLVLYCLACYLLIAGILSFLNLLPFNYADLFFSAIYLTAICWLTNKIFSKLFNVVTNLESVYITALILTLIITPNSSINYLILSGIAGVVAVASKYLLVINKKHLFNPAGFSAVTMALIFHWPFSWWVGTSYMLPVILISGILIVRKIKRFSMVMTFLILSITATLLTGNSVQNLLLETPILFFSFVMFTEPQTTPVTKKLQIVYGVFVGVIAFFQTTEMALLIGNIFSYIFSGKEKLILKLKEKIEIAPNTYDFVFAKNKPINYQAGQYMEWTLAQKKPDSRGSRRYFTLASSPTETDLRIGVKFYSDSSSFKKTIFDLSKQNWIVASQVAGEFILPEDVSKKLVFIAGGIGITPFRSMIKYLLDENEKRDIILLYSNKSKEDIVYKDIFDEADKRLGIKTIYINTDIMGYIDEKLIREKVVDFKKRTFYISGPHSMVDVFEKTLKNMGVQNIKVDFFPGYS